MIALLQGLVLTKEKERIERIETNRNRIIYAHYDQKGGFPLPNNEQNISREDNRWHAVSENSSLYKQPSVNMFTWRWERSGCTYIPPGSPGWTGSGTHPSRPALSGSTGTLPSPSDGASTWLLTPLHLLLLHLSLLLLLLLLLLHCPHRPRHPPRPLLLPCLHCQTAGSAGPGHPEKVRVPRDPSRRPPRLRRQLDRGQVGGRR